MPTNRTARILLGAAALAAELAGCAEPEASPPPVITVAALPSATGQSGIAGTTLPQPLAVQVAADGAPMPGVTVAWQASAGTDGRATSVTDSDGLTTSAWTLGVDTGVQTATAAVAEAHGSPVIFSARAFARPPAPPPVDPPAPPPPPIPSGVVQVLVWPEAWQVRPGDSYQLRAIPVNLYDEIVAGAVVTWTSRHPGVASVSASGLLTGIAPGVTTIAATSEGVRGTAAISVLGPIVSVKLMATPDTIAVGDEASWDVKARDAGGTLMVQPDAGWRSDEPAIAVAGPNGRILGVQPGTAEIAATVEGVTGHARLTVIPPLDLSGDWSMDERFGGETLSACAASGPVVLEPVVVEGESASATIDGTYQRTGICSLYRADSLDLTSAVRLHGTIAGLAVSLASHSILECQYRGVVTGKSPNRVEGRVTCLGLPGTPQDGWAFSGRFTLTK
ncbi:MAG: Ig-like domain-containing protein [Gemmatimonadales bacterium]